MNTILQKIFGKSIGTIATGLILLEIFDIFRKKPSLRKKVTQGSIEDKVSLMTNELVQYNKNLFSSFTDYINNVDEDYDVSGFIEEKKNELASYVEDVNSKISSLGHKDETKVEKLKKDIAKLQSYAQMIIKDMTSLKD